MNTLKNNNSFPCGLQMSAFNNAIIFLREHIAVEWTTNTSSHTSDALWIAMLLGYRVCCIQGQFCCRYFGLRAHCDSPCFSLCFSNDHSWGHLEVVSGQHLVSGMLFKMVHSKALGWAHLESNTPYFLSLFFTVAECTQEHTVCGTCDFLVLTDYRFIWPELLQYEI